jgi:hypothetical protein
MAIPAPTGKRQTQRYEHLGLIQVYHMPLAELLWKRRIIGPLKPLAELIDRVKYEDKSVANIFYHGLKSGTIKEDQITPATRVLEKHQNAHLYSILSKGFESGIFAFEHFRLAPALDRLLSERRFDSANLMSSLQDAAGPGGLTAEQFEQVLPVAEALGRRGHAPSRAITLLLKSKLPKEHRGSILRELSEHVKARMEPVEFGTFLESSIDHFGGEAIAPLAPLAREVFEAHQKAQGQRFALSSVIAQAHGDFFGTTPVKTSEDLKRLLEHARLAYEKGRKWSASELLKQALEAHAEIVKEKPDHPLEETLRLQREIIENTRGRFLPTKKLTLDYWRAPPEERKRERKG